VFKYLVNLVDNLINLVIEHGLYLVPYNASVAAPADQCALINLLRKFYSHAGVLRESRHTKLRDWRESLFPAIYLYILKLFSGDILCRIFLHCKAFQQVRLLKLDVSQLILKGLFERIVNLNGTNKNSYNRWNWLVM
jgi:hypothetical protein